MKRVCIWGAAAILLAAPVAPAAAPAQVPPCLVQPPFYNRALEGPGGPDAFPPAFWEGRGRQPTAVRPTGRRDGGNRRKQRDLPLLTESGEQDTPDSVTLSGRRMRALLAGGDAIVVLKNGVRVFLPEPFVAALELSDECLLTVLVKCPDDRSFSIRLSVNGQAVTALFPFPVEIHFPLPDWPDGLAGFYFEEAQGCCVAAGRVAGGQWLLAALEQCGNYTLHAGQPPALPGEPASPPVPPASIPAVPLAIRPAPGHAKPAFYPMQRWPGKCGQ